MNSYQLLVWQIRRVVSAVTHPGDSILVISRGDNELLRLENRHAMHFPLGPNYQFAGYHPANSGEAISHLESLRSGGARFLVIPETSLWWLTHYVEFREHLQNSYTRILDEPHCCVVFDLKGKPREPGETDETPAQPGSAIETNQVVAQFHEVILQNFISSGLTLRLPTSSTPELSIVVVLYNRAELTLACLRSLAENHTESFEVIVVDNASTDDTPALLDRLSGVRIIRNPRNVHFLMAANQGAREAAGRYVLFLNNDAQVLPGTIAAALNTIKTSNDIGAVGGKIIHFDGTLQEAGSIIWRDGSCSGYGRGSDPLAPEYMFRRDVDYCSGAFLLTPCGLFAEFGGFNEAFKPAYYEETDYCTRLWENGKRVVYEPDARLLHFEFASSPSRRDATLMQRTHQHIFAVAHSEFLKQRPSRQDARELTAGTHTEFRHRVFLLDDRIPHPSLGAGAPRANSIVRSLVKQNSFVTVYPMQFVHEDWPHVYTDLPREVEVVLERGVDGLEPFLQERQGFYDRILVSRPHNMKSFKTILEEKPQWFEQTSVIYDAEAIFAERDLLLRKLEGDPGWEKCGRQWIDEELAIARIADRVIAISANNARVFREHGCDRVFELGHTIIPAPTERSFQDRNGFLFVGPLTRGKNPNVDAVLWFITEVFPLIRQELPDAVFTVAGNNESSRVSAHAGADIRFVPRTPDLSDLYDRSRVFVAPTRFAAGIPHKIHEAAARGLPVVATKLLADQLGWIDGMELFIGSDAATFAGRCIELYRDAAAWGLLRESALRRVRSECSPDLFDNRIREILD